jgi:hypothetical protein
MSEVTFMKDSKYGIQGVRYYGNTWSYHEPRWMWPSHKGGWELNGKKPVGDQNARFSVFVEGEGMSFYIPFMEQVAFKEEKGMQVKRKCYFYFGEPDTDGNEYPAKKLSPDQLNKIGKDEAVAVHLVQSEGYYCWQRIPLRPEDAEVAYRGRGPPHHHTLYITNELPSPNLFHELPADYLKFFQGPVPSEPRILIARPRNINEIPRGGTRSKHQRKRYRKRRQTLRRS